MRSLAVPPSSGLVSLPQYSGQLTPFFEGADATNRDALILLTSREMYVALLVLTTVIQFYVRDGRLYFAMEALVHGRPINFVTYTAKDFVCRTAADVPCQLHVDSLHGDSIEDLAGIWRNKVPGIQTIDCRR